MKITEILYLLRHWSSRRLPKKWRIPIMRWAAGSEVSYALTVHGSPARLVYDGGVMEGWYLGNVPTFVVRTSDSAYTPFNDGREPLRFEVPLAHAVRFHVSSRA